MDKWETVPSPAGVVQRFPVPGGWLYNARGSITFVPEPAPKVSIGNVSKSVTGPAEALGYNDPVELPLEGPSVPATVVVGRQGASRPDRGHRVLVVQGVKHHDKMGILIHEVDVAEVAVENLTTYIKPNRGAGNIDKLAHKVAAEAAEFMAFFENKYKDQPIRCPYIHSLFRAVDNLTDACDEYAATLTHEIEAHKDCLSEAPIG